MNAIGGYFGMELQQMEEYHLGNIVRLNTGRNAFEYILLAHNFRKVYIPYFTCDVVLEPVRRNGIEFEFYEIDESFEPVFNFERIESHAAFLYTNYFGLKDIFIDKLAGLCKNLIVDNAQSFYSRPLPGISSFYSPRKFFGLADGGYAYANSNLDNEFPQDYSSERFEHLLVRLDQDAESGYGIFSKNDKSLENQPIKKMSSLTHLMLKSIDYEGVARRRIRNFGFFDQHLSSLNQLILNRGQDQVPMVYPLWVNDGKLKEKLLKNKIYCASYWPNVLEWASPSSLEYRFARELIHLPIDQRYDENDLKRILKIVLE